MVGLGGKRSMLLNGSGQTLIDHQNSIPGITDGLVLQGSADMLLELGNELISSKRGP